MVDEHTTAVPLPEDPGAFALVHLCRRGWDDLTPTADARVRHCDDCGQRVHLVADRHDVERAVAECRCVAVTGKLTFVGSPEGSQYRPDRGGLPWPE